MQNFLVTCAFLFLWAQIFVVQIFSNFHFGLYNGNISCFKNSDLRGCNLSDCTFSAPQNFLDQIKEAFSGPHMRSSTKLGFANILNCSLSSNNVKCGQLVAEGGAILFKP
jgi:uncharacterized protein YjbI with pentapeptide repeats